MAHFYGDLQGNRGEATRMGTKNSGIKAHIRGWNFGVKVQMSVDKDGNDVATVYLTSGSNGHRASRWMGEFTIEDLND